MPEVKCFMRDIQCPNCGAYEMHPTEDKLLIRAYKITTRRGHGSQCLVCSGYYDKDLNETPENHEAGKGWFYD